jgi:hypothetical protein
MAGNSINNLLIVFVVVILGVIAAGIIAGQIITNTAQVAASAETIDISSARIAGNNINNTLRFTLTNAPTGWKAQQADCYIKSFVLANSSGTAYTDTTNYILTDSAGTFTLVNGTIFVAQMSNTTIANYNYCGNGYIASSFGRSSLNMVVGFFALLILIIVVAAVVMLVKQYKED